jgi:sec-independent protein translocase protein TatC
MMRDEATEQQPTQSLTDHLTELRDRLIRSVYAIGFGAIICWFFADKILATIAEPIKRYLKDGKLVFLSPTDMFVAHMKIALTCGAILACPVWIYQIWKFVAPGLYANEKKYSTIFISAGTFLFLIGVAFSYFLVLPMGLHFLLTFAGDTGQPMITLPEYLGFFTTMSLVFGGAFELPLVIVILGAMGLVDQKFLRDKRRYAIVAMACVSAIITPPDVMSMLTLLGPLWILYEISIVLVGIVVKKKAQPTDSVG